MRPDGWRPFEREDRHAWNDWRIKVLVGVLPAVLIYGVVATTPAPAW